MFKSRLIFAVTAAVALALIFLFILAISLRPQAPEPLAGMTQTAPTGPAADLTPPLDPAPAIPHSMKGYELYSWQAGDRWYFTLITGTNRSKTLDEITAEENSLTGDDWVKITVQGVDAIKAVLNRVPAGESVFWIGAPGLAPASSEADRLAWPPQEVVEQIQEHGRLLDLDLYVSGETGAATPTPQVLPTPDGFVHPLPSSPSPDAAATLDPTATAAQPLPTGLTLEEYALNGPPDVEPLTFSPLEGSQAEILARRALERRYSVGVPSYFYEGHFSMHGDLGAGELIASEIHEARNGGWVTVRRNGEEIDRIRIGPGTPIAPLRGLWAFDDHWVLETAHFPRHQEDTTIYRDAVGQIKMDGELLNERYGYSEMFGFQLMAGRPFYFFEQDGEIGFAYDGQVVAVGYDEIPHYRCCSAGVLNPVSTARMVAFFARRDGVWYYVEIGVYE